MISAFIPFRDWSLERLKTCVSHLRDKSSIDEIIVVDYGSTHALPRLSGCRTVRVVADRWCLSEANNIGIAEARNSVVLKIDADVQLLLDDATLQSLEQQVSDGSVAFFNLQVTDFYSDGGHRTRLKLHPTWGEGGANLFSKSAIVEVGGFDTRFFGYGGEDNDLCNRLRRYGKRVETFQSDKVLNELHPPSSSQQDRSFSASRKAALLADRSAFRPHPFRYSDYKDSNTFGPTITVAIATKDRPERLRHLHHCLRGLAQQTFDDFEVRICENGLEEGTRIDQAAIRAAFPTLDIHFHALKEPSIPKARNLITDAARGFYIAISDDDDFSLPDRFEEQLKCIAETEGASGCHSSWIEFDEKSGRLTRYSGQRRDVNELMRRRGKITLHSSGFYRRDVLSKMRYNEELNLGADYDLSIRMTLSGLVVQHTGKFHCLRRLHDFSVTNTGPNIQRGVSDIVNGAYRFFLGEPFLTSIRETEEENLWVTGFPSKREMLSYLPEDFGAFRIELTLEAALSLGLDPLVASVENNGALSVEGVSFAAACRGYGQKTRLVLRSCEPLTAGEVRAFFPVVGKAKGADIVNDSELRGRQTVIGLEGIQVAQGQRQIISRRYGAISEALGSLPKTVLDLTLGEVRFFAVNDPVEGVHVLLGTFATASDLDHALNLANSGTRADYFAVSNKGKRGGFVGG